MQNFAIPPEFHYQVPGTWNFAIVEFQSSPETKNYCDVIKTVKKDNVTRENIGNIMLMQIPGISATLATAILDNFENFPDFVRKVNEDSSCLNGLTYTSNGKSRKINKNCIENIKSFLAT